MTLKTCAAFTMSREEPLWLFVWLNHYARELGEQNCYVLCEPGDETIDLAREHFHNAHFVHVPSGRDQIKNDHYGLSLEMWRLDTVRKWQELLLRDYKVVIFGDTDEFLVPSGGLLDWIETSLKGRTRVRSECWSPVDVGALFPSPLAGESALKNCYEMWRQPNYDKTLLVTQPQVYARGFHYTYGEDGTGSTLNNGLRKRISDPIDETLPMIHTWRSDFEDWFRDGSWRYSLNRRQAQQTFIDHVLPNTTGEPLIVGEPKEVPESWRRKLVIPHDR